MPAPNNHKPKVKPSHTALSGVPARCQSANRTASASTGIGKIPNGAKPNTQINPANNANKLSFFNKPILIHYLMFSKPVQHNRFITHAANRLTMNANTGCGSMPHLQRRQDCDCL